MTLLTRSPSNPVRLSTHATTHAELADIADQLDQLIANAEPRKPKRSSAS